MLQRKPGRSLERAGPFFSGRVGDRLRMSPAEPRGAPRRRFGERKRGAAKSTFGRQAADIPVGVPASRAVVRLTFAINDMIAAHGEIM